MTSKACFDNGNHNTSPEGINTPADTHVVAHEIEGIEDGVLMRRTGAEVGGTRKIVDKGKGMGHVLRSCTSDAGDGDGVQQQQVPRSFTTCGVPRSASFSRHNRSSNLGSRVEIVGELDDLTVEQASLENGTPFSMEYSTSNIPQCTSPQKGISPMTTSILVRRCSSGKLGDDQSLSLPSGLARSGPRAASKWSTVNGMEDVLNNDELDNDIH